MSCNRPLSRVAAAFVMMVVWAFAGCQFDSWIQYQEPQSSDATRKPDAAEENQLTIETDTTLPDASPHKLYHFQFVVRGGSPPLHWRIAGGVLPHGIHLEENGMILGVADRSGEFQFMAEVSDSRGRGVRNKFRLTVGSALIINWKTMAHVNGNRVEGSVAVTNTTGEDIDLTFLVLAVAENGRAMAIGYQHFPLTSGTQDMDLPFDDTLPPGGYVVYVNVIGEVDVHNRIYNRIYRERLQTPNALHVTVGP